MLLLSILPLLQCSLSNEWCPRVLATDASNSGAGVVSTNNTQQLFNYIWPLTASKHTLYATITAFTSINNNKQSNKNNNNNDNELQLKQLIESDDDEIKLYQPSVQSCINNLSSLNSCVTNLYNELSSTQLVWQTLISHKWHYNTSHINTLELQSVILSMRRQLSSPSFINNRLLLLCDSSVVCYSLTKGRSSSSYLIPGLRKIAALCLASNCSLQVGWIPTDLNPADKPSRQ
jgi:hypothetical protein